MATALQIGDFTLASRRQEIFEWRASLATRTDTEILGLKSGATPADAKAAFVSLARRFHPDAAPSGNPDLRDPLQAIFVRITEAYHNLGSSSRTAPDPPRRGAVVPQSPVRSVGAAGPRPIHTAAKSVADDAEQRRARVDEALRTAEELIDRQQTEDAVATLHEVLTQADDARRRRIRLLLARAYALDPRWRRNAVAVLRDLVEQDSADAEAMAALGSLYRREGLLARAEHMFVRALAVDPGLAAAREGLRAVRAALAARQTPDAATRAPQGGLIARLFSVAR